MKIKRLLTALIVVLTLSATSMALFGCALFGGDPRPETGTGGAPTQEQLLGRWNLSEQWTSGRSFGSSRPGDALWVGGYFIEFNEDGTFSEIAFWNHLNTVRGTWTLNDSTLTLIRISGADGGLAFIGTRTLEINTDGTVLMMIYTRPNPSGRAWDYVNTFTRHAPSQR